MILTGLASAVNVCGIALVDAGEYVIKIGAGSEEYNVLSDPATMRIPTFNDWSMDVKMNAPLPARNYGVLSCSGWDGSYLKEWKASIQVATEEAPQQSQEWIERCVSGIDWEAESTKYVDSSTKHVFIQAALVALGYATVSTPLLGGVCVYGDGETAGKNEPKEEKISFKGHGAFTAGTIYPEIVSKMMSYRQALMVVNGAVPAEVISISGLGSGMGFLTKFEAESDGKTLKLALSVEGHGKPSFT